jgi:hypothetical protein
MSKPGQLLSELPLTTEQKRELLQRVLHSPLFSRCSALRAFLNYVTENAIAGNLELIKEQSIGSAALGREPGYDPTSDNIVRVRAHELRQKLEKHFETVGAQEPVIISVPRGTYIPEFRVRVVSAPPTTDSRAVDTLVREAEVAPEAKSGTPKFETPPAAAADMAGGRRFWDYLPWVFASVLAVALILSLLHNSNARPAAKGAKSQQAVRDFWGPLFAEPNRDVLAISADSGFALWQNFTNQDLNLADYLARKDLQFKPPDPFMRELAARRLTSPADVVITARISALSQAFGGHLVSEYARNVNLQQFRTANAVVIGSRRSNPWAELFEAKLNFVLVRNSQTGASVFRNRSPKQGEAAVYGDSDVLASLGTEQHEVDSYALIAVVRGLAESGRVVLLEGLNMEGTQAAGETVTDPVRLDQMLRQLGHQAGTPVPPFEALLKLTSVPGGYTESKTIAFRYLRN